MAFTGSPTIVQISDRKVRITGLSLASGASGTIGLFGNNQSTDVVLPQSFNPQPYSSTTPPSTKLTTISVQESIAVSMVPVTAVTTAIPVDVVKTGTDAHNFVATLTNNHGSITSPGLEIFVEWH